VDVFVEDQIRNGGKHQAASWWSLTMTLATIASS
jgi:hypothetical protein